MGGAGNNPDIQPQPCFVFLGSFEQLASLDQFRYKMDKAEPAEEKEQTNQGQWKTAKEERKGCEGPMRKEKAKRGG